MAMPLENVDQIIGSNLRGSDKKMLSIISPTRATSNENTRFVCEKFVTREADKKKVFIEFPGRIRSNFIVD